MSSNKVSNKHSTILARPFFSFLISLSFSGSGVAILSNFSDMVSSSFSITTPLIFLVRPCNFLLILSVAVLISKETSITSPVNLSIKLPSSFFSDLRANSINSLITFSILVDGSPPHLPSARFTDLHLSLST